MDFGDAMAIGVALFFIAAFLRAWRRGRDDRPEPEIERARQTICDYAGVRYERVNWPVAVARAIDNTRDAPEVRARVLAALDHLLPPEES